jgi:hypothetical protein
LRNWIEQAGPDRFKLDPTFMRAGDDPLIGSMHGSGAEEIADARFYVLTIRDNKIADMQMCGSRRQAQRFARRQRSRTRD